MRDRMRVLAPVVGLVVLGAVTTARGDVDLNGEFTSFVSLLPFGCATTVTQVGSAIELEANCGVMQFGGNGTIDPVTGVFNITGGCVVGPLFGALTIDATAPDSNSFAGTFSCPPAVPGGPYGYVAERSDGEPACELRNDCRGDQKSLFMVKNGDDEASDKLLWKWLKGDATATEDFGTPSGTAAYTLCVFAGTSGATIGQFALPSDPVKWAAIGDKGWKYKDAAAATGGLQTILLKSGAAGKAKIIVKGKGSQLPDLFAGALPAEPPDFPIAVQLRRDGTDLCWQSTFGEAGVKKNSAALFKAKSP